MLPETQQNYELAQQHALASASNQSPEGLIALGAERIKDNCYNLPVLEATLTANLEDGAVTLVSDGTPIGLSWQIIVLHYLSAPVPWPESTDWQAFADFQDLRGYEPVYQGRVLGRLCGTAGRTEEGFIQAAESLNAQPFDRGDIGYRFPIFPHLDLIVGWYRADEDFPSNATILYPDNIRALLPLEDIIVLAECLVARLGGKGW